MWKEVTWSSKSHWMTTAGDLSIATSTLSGTASVRSKTPTWTPSDCTLGIRARTATMRRRASMACKPVARTASALAQGLKGSAHQVPTVILTSTAIWAVAHRLRSLAQFAIIEMNAVA